jgi:Ni2+-binding GTPase involved in maturation of urease and hydrogenase
MSKRLSITVAGSAAGCGKTTLAERLIPCLSYCAAVKAHVKEDEPFAVQAEESPSQSPAKDTARFLAAGARRAYLIHGPAARAAEAVIEIVREGEFATLIVESNALACALEADLAFFVEGGGEDKPGADACRREADVIVAGVKGERSVE